MANLLDTAQEVEFYYDFRQLIGGMVRDFKSFSDSIISIALLVSLIIVIYHVVHDAKYGKGKQAVMSWFIALGIWIVVRSLF